MKSAFSLPSPLESLKWDFLDQYNIKISIKRDDLIHPEVSGNKWRKLKLNIARYQAGKYEGLLTFGGAYSNHISAVAATGNLLNIPTIGLIRGDELNPESNATLQQAHQYGMSLHFLSRSEYGLRYEKGYHHELREQFGNVLVIEEGGANYYGAMGCTEIVAETPINPDYFVLPSGTGTTATGVLLAAEQAKVIAVPVFKNGGFIRDEIHKMMRNCGWGEEEISEKDEQLLVPTEYHFGGYGKYTADLIAFINRVYAETGLKLDQVYTAKMFFALYDMIQKGEIEAGSEVVVIHTGGLQGLSSIKDQLNFQPNL